jgi:cytochrome c oxidase subunit 1
MPRRIAVYNPGSGFGFLNLLSSIGGWTVGLSFVFFLLNILISYRKPVPAGDNPWVYGQALEWATTSPPPHHNFNFLPPIRSERPTWDMNFGHDGTGPAHAPPEEVPVG